MSIRQKEVTHSQPTGGPERVQAVAPLTGEPVEIAKPSWVDKLSGRRVLIIVENLPVPPDRRVWQEARTLRDAGCQVSVICPKGPGYETSFEILEGIRIYRHPLPIEARGASGYLLEYSCALFWETWLSIRIALREGFDAIHACNPPDLIFLVGALHKLFGKKFVFDHHDLNPELFTIKFGGRNLLYRLLLLMERLTFATADVVISTNESYRRIALGRGGKSETDVFVVRSSPTAAIGRSGERECHDDAPVTIGYVGIMGSQDGVDSVLRIARRLIDGGRSDLKFLIIGDGPEAPALKQLCSELNLDDYVTFTGFLTGDALHTAMASMDIGVCPDEYNDYNDKCTMNKIMEYMAMGIPVVQFDLTEGRVTSGDTALYAKRNDEQDLAAQLVRLVDDKAFRMHLGELGAIRFEQTLQWHFEQPKLVAAYERLFARRR